VKFINLGLGIYKSAEGYTIERASVGGGWYVRLTYKDSGLTVTKYAKTMADARLAANQHREASIAGTKLPW
jgi:hypothetical protein